MAGLRGNIASVGTKKQVAKGTAETVAFTENEPFEGGNIAPTREIDNLAETDANRDQGLSFVRQTSAGGAPEVYGREKSLHHHLERALGAIATVGASDYTHTLTPANAIPYVTVVKTVGATLHERYKDCKYNELTIAADTGGPLVVTFDVLGTSVAREASAPTLPAQISGAPLNMNQATVTLGGGATALVSTFEVTISNNVSVQQTDDSVPYDVVEGVREVTLGFQLIFETLDEYNKFHYGGAAGTTQSPNIFTTSADFIFAAGVNNSAQFTFPSIAYEEFPVEPDPGGDPIVVDVRARAQRGASPVLTAVVKNQVAT